jgi:subtilisin family serine protease
MTAGVATQVSATGGANVATRTKQSERIPVPFARCSLIVCLCALITPNLVRSQGMNNALKIRLAQRRDMNKPFDLLVKGDIPKLRSQYSASVKVNYSIKDIASVNCYLQVIPQLLAEKVITCAEFTEARKRPLNDTMVVRNRIKPVKRGDPPFQQPYNGKGVVLGFIDTGIDYHHGDFKDANGKTRIAFIWDQYPISGSPVPQPFNYGIEWRAGQIDSGSCTHTGLAYYGHGTHVAGIGAGNGRASGRNQGCASESDIIMVALDFGKSGPTIADAAQYIFNKAAQMGKPCVVNASLGDYYGSHDGTDLEAQLIANMVAGTKGKAIAAAVGNAGNINFHVFTQVAQDTAFTWLDGGNPGQYWCYGDTLQVKNLQFAIGANGNDFSDVGRTAFRSYDYSLNGTQSDTIWKNGKRIGIVQISAAINSKGVYELYYEIDADSSGLLWRMETKGVGQHHAWNFDFVEGPLPSSQQYPFIAKYRMPDSDYSMVSGFQCHEEIITVGNYVNRSKFYDVHGILRDDGENAGYLAPNSSSGPTRDGRIKPDISATGDGIFSSFPLPLLASLLVNTPSVVAQGSMHVISGGSSASSPVVAGLAALFLERHPEASNREIRNAIRFCAYQDAYTGGNLPDFHWGYGKLDGRKAMICAEPPPPLGLAEENLHGIMASPNPFTEKVKLSIPGGKGRIDVFDSTGRLLFSNNFNGTEITLNSYGLPKGLIFVRVSSESNSQTIKLLAE